MIHHDQELDTSGLRCPLPLLQAKQAIAALLPGQVLRVISTDPSSILDFNVYAQTSGHQLLASYTENQRYFFLLKKNNSL